jgi:hypothetical protein
MSNKKQTAVEWLINELDLDNDSWNMKRINQAKEMFEQQIIDAWDSAYGGDNNHDGEQYYNETFKSE